MDKHRRPIWQVKNGLKTSNRRNRHPCSRLRRDARRSRADPAPGVPICMRRGAQLWADQGWRLFEPQASLARPRPKRAPQVPVAPAEGADSWGAFLWVTFLWRSKKGDCAAGRNSRPTMLASTQKTLFRYRPSRRTARRGQSPIAGQEHAFTASSRRAMGI